MLIQNNERNVILVKNVPQKGNGVFAKSDFTQGELVVIGKPVTITPYRTMTSFQMDWNKHVELDSPAKVINHSCDPNLGVKNNEYGGYSFYALRDIAAGTELTWDYNTTEYESISVSTCHCGAWNCREKTYGFKFLETELRAQYGEYIANYLKNTTKTHSSKLIH